MATEVSATEAARRFSDLLNAVQYRHDSFLVMRGGKPAAAIVPMDSLAGGKPLKELENILKTLPSLNADSESFSRDLNEIILSQPSVPKEQAWE